MGFKMEYFLVLHLTSMAVFASMLWHFHKRKKISKASSDTTSSMRERFDKFVILFKRNVGNVLALSICSVLLFIFMQFHVQNFMSSLDVHRGSSGASNFVESASGHWIIFSAMPTIYYFFVTPLFEDWENI
jgi:hypothetical protein